jgi:hypothetical protein
MMPAHRVNLRVRAHELVADEPVDAGVSITPIITVPVDLPDDRRQHLAHIAEQTPVTLAVCERAPITTTFMSRNS